MSKKSPAPIYVVSGGTGIAGNNLVQAILIQYPENKVPVEIIGRVTTEDEVFDIIMKAKADRGLIAHTMVNPELRHKINELGKEFNVKVIDLMGTLANYLDETLDVEPMVHPGLYREINHQYFDRIDSIEFTLSQDDGMSPERLRNAEIILTGVSRAGKTPLSVYLAMYGWKVANVPLVPGVQPPDELFEADPNRVFGLYIGASQLIAHRQKRIANWENYRNDAYVDQRAVREEIRKAMFVFDRGGFTVINVSNKPIESTANEILSYMSKRFSYRGRKLSSPYHATDEPSQDSVSE
ncbi:pyruvate, water dikinase regulatory protein [Draconibacterium sp. IB214405]|uniref:pyruvate, water dikinase regulatory protein n=1 Tax=Draconibacterium sp. IB214405 TaxID=3097352 RepID=UPI002A11BC25|nr:pyruvate, water dikinase regulatory protein [Draconibacterium sp. IB214405]MDX8338136.1 pyruvate, water dikinase regulatory protein [Draconibacterium sp. IB214405]